MTYSTARSETFKQAFMPAIRSGYADIISLPRLDETALITVRLGVFFGLGQFITSPFSHRVNFVANNDGTWTAKSDSIYFRQYLRLYFRAIGDMTAHSYLDDPNYFDDVEYLQRDRWNTLHRKSRAEPLVIRGARTNRYNLYATREHPFAALQTLRAETRAFFLMLVASVQAKAHS